jgi:Tfp pilus assembly protein PilF
LLSTSHVKGVTRLVIAFTSLVMGVTSHVKGVTRLVIGFTSFVMGVTRLVIAFTSLVMGVTRLVVASTSHVMGVTRLVIAFTSHVTGVTRLVIAFTSLVTTSTRLVIAVTSLVAGQRWLVLTTSSPRRRRGTKERGLYRVACRVGGWRMMRGMGARLGGILAAAACLAACGGATPAVQGETATLPAGPSTAVPEANTLPSGPDPAPSAELDAGIKAFDAGSYAEARKSFEAAIKRDKTNYKAFFDLGQACEKLGDKSAAETAYKAALALRPELDQAAEQLSALYIDAGRIDDALTVGRTGLAKHPGSAALHENLGIALATRGDQEPATQELEAAIKLTPSEPMYHLTLAHWLNVWHVRGAAPHLDAIRETVKDYALLASVGFEYRMAGEFDGCIKTFDRAIGMKDGGEVRTERALCRLGTKDEKAALDDLQAAIAAEPTYAPAHYYLGGRLASGKHYKEAAAEYAKYLELAPSGSLAKNASERLKMAQEAASKDKGGAPKRK